MIDDQAAEFERLVTQSDDILRSLERSRSFAISHREPFDDLTFHDRATGRCIVDHELDRVTVDHDLDTGHARVCEHGEPAGDALARVLGELGLGRHDRRVGAVFDAEPGRRATGADHGDHGNGGGGRCDDFQGQGTGEANVRLTPAGDISSSHVPSICPISDEEKRRRTAPTPLRTARASTRADSS